MIAIVDALRLFGGYLVLGSMSGSAGWLLVLLVASLGLMIWGYGLKRGVLIASYMTLVGGPAVYLKEFNETLGNCALFAFAFGLYWVGKKSGGWARRRKEDEVDRGDPE